LDNDADLIRRIRTGDAQAMVALYRRYLPPVWRYVRARVGGDVHAAEDAVSETFLVAVDNIADLDPDAGSVYAWLIGIARHKAGDHLRRARRAATLPLDAPPPAARAADPAADPPAALEAAERRAELAAALERLSDEQRLVLEWKYVDGLSVRRIADCLARTEKSVESLLYRARADLRRRLAGPPDPPPGQGESKP